MSGKKLVAIQLEFREPETSDFDVKDFDAVIFSTLPCKLSDAIRNDRTHTRRYVLDSPIPKPGEDKLIDDILRRCDRDLGFSPSRHRFEFDK